MSSRTAGANRAIREAWENEKRLVLEGKGTRDWTDEQQRQIQELGKVYDEKGIAFQGQHMKSFSAYPEYQDDSRNIQLLSREEHFAAHGCDWTRMTNGYFDPVLNAMSSDFGDGPPQPCVELTLTNPLYANPLNASSAQTSASESKSGRSPTGATSARASGWRQRTQSLQRVAQQAWKDPRVRGFVIASGATLGEYALNRATSAGKNRTNAPSTQTSPTAAPGPGTDSLLRGRQSPEAHGVSGYTKKDGTNVRQYRRGEKKD